MAGIGLYGVYYSKCNKVNGVTTGYSGSVKQMGKAISASLEFNTPEDNPLYANNGVAENDISAGSGGTLTMTLDRMTLETHADLFGTSVESVSVQAGGKSVEGKEIAYKGSEVSEPVGIAYIKMQQEDGVRHHDVLFFREGTVARPGDEAATMGESIEWQTPEVTANIAGVQGDGTEPWYRMARFPSQEAAIAYVMQLFGGTEGVGV